MIDGEPWFVAVDVARALGFNVEKGIGKYLSAVEADERQVIEMPTPGRIGGKGPVTVFAESGLYALINRSDKPEAKVFQRWVNREVLPSIRKTGSYSLADHGREAMPLPMDIAEALSKCVSCVGETPLQKRSLLQASAEP